MYRIVTAIVCLLCFAYTALHGQTIYFQHWNVENGLSQSQVLDIIQDREGYLWMSTYGGVSRYDGRNFTNYTLREGLESNSVRKVHQDAKGRIWFGTYGGGLSMLLPNANDSLQIRTFSTKNGWLENDYIFHLTEDHKGQLWLATNGGGVVLMPKGFEQSGVPLPLKTITSADGLPSDRVYSVLEDRDHNIWIGTWKGVAKYNPETKQISTYTTENGLPHNFVVTLYQDKAGKVWAGTYGAGAACLDPNLSLIHI